MADRKADDEFHEVAAFVSQDDARKAAETLIESGVGSSVEKLTHTDEETGIEVIAYQVNVLGVQLQRAQEVLGFAEMRFVLTGDDDQPIKPQKGKTSWKAVLAIWIIALITIPAAAFFFTVWVLGR